jgi:hypothetical protein
MCFYTLLIFNCLSSSHLGRTGHFYMLKYTALLGSVVDIKILKSLEFSAWKSLDVHKLGKDKNRKKLEGVIYQVMVQMIWHHVVTETTYCLQCQTNKKVHNYTRNICLLRGMTQNEVERSQKRVQATVFLNLTQCGKKSTMVMIKFKQSSSTKTTRKLNMHP